MSGELGRLVTVAWLSLRASLRGLRLIGLAAFAALPTVIMASLVSAHPGADALSNAALSLFAILTLPIVAMVILLVLSVAQFRTEIDTETLVYLSDRSVGRPTIVLGKYLGSLTAALVLVLPASLVPLGIAVLAGGTPYAAGVPADLAAAIVLAAAAYGAFFLVLGLVSRSALLIGLLFGFLWEELLALLPGSVPRLTLVFYVRSLLSQALPTGPLSGYPNAVDGVTATIVPIGVAFVLLVLGGAVFRYLETAPEKASA